MQQCRAPGRSHDTLLNGFGTACLLMVSGPDFNATLWIHPAAKAESAAAANGTCPSACFFLPLPYA
jgi:hypothetical protein